MSQELFSIEEDKGIYGAKMKAIGVGGGGVNMINHMIKEGLDRIELIVANTDAQSLNATRSDAHKRAWCGYGSRSRCRIG